MYAFRGHYKTPTAPTSVIFYLAYLRLWIHIKDCHRAQQWELHHHSTVNVSESDALFKTRSYIYSPIWIQLSWKQVQLQRCSQSTKWKKYRRSETSCWQQSISDKIRWEFVAYNSIQKKFDYFFFVAFLKLLTMKYLLSKAVKASVIKSGMAFIICPWRHLFAVHFFFFFSFTSGYNARYNVVWMNRHDIFGAKIVSYDPLFPDWECSAL